MATFNTEELRDFAIELEQLGEKYAQQDENVRSFMVGMAFVLDQSKKMKLREPLESVPGSYRFVEGDLREYPELQHAYVEFADRLSRDDESYRRFKAFIAERIRSRAEGNEK